MLGRENFRTLAKRWKTLGQNHDRTVLESPRNLASARARQSSQSVVGPRGLCRAVIETTDR